MYKRALSFLLALCMIVSFFPVVSLAAETQTPEPVTATHINPLYADVMTEADLAQPSQWAVMPLADVTYHADASDVGEEIRPSLVARTETIIVGYQIPEAEFTSDGIKAIGIEIFDAAFAHTGSPVQGDYLERQYGGWTVSASGDSYNDDTSAWNSTVTFTVTYYTTYDQESEMDVAVAALVEELGLDNSSLSDYEKLELIYDWMCDNITYDYANLNDDSYKLKYTAYAALINKTAVCQGYANLLYRLALHVDIDCRIITGVQTSTNGGHAWNIVKLGSKYYNADATWDINYKSDDSYQYFLRADSTFADHTRDDVFTTESFYASYPMGTADYDPNAAEAVSLTVWAGESDQTWLLEQLEAFAAAHPEWDLTFETGVCGAGSASSVVTADGADVYMYTNDQRATLTGNGVLAPLTGDALAQVKADNSATMVDTVSDVNGNVYGFPMSGNTWFMYYNKSIYSESDITSLETMLSKGKVAFPLTNAWYMPAFYFANGGTMFGEAGNDASAGIQFGGENGTAVTKYLVNLIQNANFVNDADGAGNSGLQDGTIGAYFSGSWEYAGLSSSLGENLGVAQLPTITIGGEAKQLKAFTGSTAVGVNPNAENAEAAQALAAFLGSAESQKARYESCGVIPTVSALADEIADPLAKAQINTINNTATVQPTVAEMANFWGAASNFGYALANGEVTEDNAAEVTENWNGLMNGTYSGNLIPDGSGTSSAVGGECGDNLTWVLENGTLTISGTGAMYDYGWSEEGEKTVPWAQYLQSDIQTLVVEEGVTTIGDCTFSGSYALETAVLPEGLTVIGDDAFQASSLVEVTIPSTVTYIGDWAFQACNMTSVTIPAGVTYIGDRAFDDCSNVTAYQVAADNANYASVDGVLFDKEITKLIQYPAGSAAVSYEIPGTVTTIGGGSMACGGALESLTIGAGVTAIEDYAFSGNDSLTAIHVVADNPNYSSVDGVLLNKDGTVLLTCPAGYIAENGTYTVPNGVEIIETESFRYCDFQKLVLSDSVKTVNYLAFTYMYNLESIDLASVQVIGDNVFQGCTALSSLTIPATVTEIGGRLFTDGENLDTITFLGDAPALGGEAEWDPTFTDVTATAYYPAGNATWTEEVMASYGGTITWVSYEGEAPEVPDTSTISGTYGGVSWSLNDEGYLTMSGSGEMEDQTSASGYPWYEYRDQIKRVFIYEITSVGDHAFENYTNLEYFSINEATRIGEYAFAGCTAMTDCNLSEVLTSIEAYAFSGSSIYYIQFHSDPPAIDETAFTGVTATAQYPYGNTAWTADVMQNYGGTITWVEETGTLASGSWEGGYWEVMMNGHLSVYNWSSDAPVMTDQTSADAYPWYEYSSDIISIYVGENWASIGAYAFAGYPNLTQVTVGPTVTSIGANAFANNAKLTEIQFTGDAPAIDSTTFTGVTANVLHYSDKSGWTDALKGNYGGSLTWVVLCSAHESVTDEAVAPTCTETGLTAGSHCGLCGKVLVAQETVPATGHTEVTDEAVASTCTETGLTAGSHCSVCNEILVAQETVPAAGHTEVKDPAVAPTCTETGLSEGVFCPVCGESLKAQEIVPATGHTEVTDAAVAATCTETGLTEGSHCSVCNEVLVKQEVVAATGHTYENNVCTGCGHEISTVDAPVVKGTNLASTGKIKLTWAAVDGAAKYQVYRATSKTGTYKLLKTTTGTSFTNTSAVAGTTYYYYVVAVDAEGVASAQSNIVTRTCDCARPTVTISNVASSGKIRLTWEEVDGAVKYQVYRATSKTGTYTLMKTTTGTSYTNTSAKAGTQYYYKVRAVGSKSAATSAYSTVVTRTCDCAQPVVTISNVASSGKIRLTWKAVDGAVKYQVYRATSKTGTYTLMKTTTGTSYTNTSAKVGTTYYYKVRAIAEKSAANSVYSSIVSRTCDLPRPEVTIALNTSGKPRLTWEAVDGATKYKVYRSTSGEDGTWSLMKTTTGTSYTNTSAKVSTTYYYKVMAVHTKSAANSAYSEVKFVNCTSVNISGSKLSKTVVNQINEYRAEAGVADLQWYTAGEMAAKIRAAELAEYPSSYRPDGSSPSQMLADYGIYFELDVSGFTSASALVDAMMSDADVSELCLLDAFSAAVVARNGQYWTVMFVLAE